MFSFNVRNYFFQLVMCSFQLFCEILSEKMYKSACNNIIPKRFYRKFSGHISLTSGNQGNLRKGHCKNEA